MRLSEEERNAIISVLKQKVRGEATLWLYGSRTDQTKKGGDIDLLLLTSEEEGEALHRELPAILVEIKEVIGDQRIDLTISSADRMKEDPFLRSLEGSLLKLADFGDADTKRGLL